MNNLFKYFSSSKAPFYFPGLFFLVGAAFMLASLFLAWRSFQQDRRTALQQTI
jgi:DHA1 family tetracycline resistance protein-like MFS transporter